MPPVEPFSNHPRIVCYVTSGGRQVPIYANRTTSLVEATRAARRHLSRQPAK